MQHIRLFLILVSCLAISACSIPEGDQTSPENAHYQWIRARRAGDQQALWSLLHPKTQKEFNSLLELNKKLIKEIQKGYPDSDAVEALKSIDASTFSKARNAQELFARFLTPLPEAESGDFGVTASMGARVRSTTLDEDGTHALLTLHSGDKLRLEKGDDEKWYVLLEDTESLHLSQALSRAKENLKRVERNVKKLHENN